MWRPGPGRVPGAAGEERKPFEGRGGPGLEESTRRECECEGEGMGQEEEVKKEESVGGRQEEFDFEFQLERCACQLVHI